MVGRSSESARERVIADAAEKDQRAEARRFLNAVAFQAPNDDSDTVPADREVTGRAIFF